MSIRLLRSSTPPGWMALAQGLGVPTRRIEKASDIAPAIEAGVASGHANLIDIGISAP